MSSNTNLGNTPVNQGFVQLIHTGETGGIDGTLRTLFDGDGTASDLQIASDKVKISTELFIGSKTLTEFVQDTVGAMFSSNTETNITATYQDDDGTIDLVSSGEVTLTGSQTLSNKTLTSPIIDSVTISTIQTGSESFADNDTSLMTSAAINDKIGTEVASLVDSAPGTLDTLNELAAALGDDPNFATTTATNIATKLAKASNLSDLANASTARSNLGVDEAGTDNSTNVTLANTNYLSISGQEITGGTIPVASGGTGATSASGARTALGIGAIGQLATISVSNFNDAALQTSSESFADNDTSIMTSAAIQDKIQSFGFTTNTGDMTGVSITANDPLDISQSNTLSGDYSATISLDASEFQGYLTDKTDNNLGADELLIIDSGDTTLKRKAINEIKLTTFDSTGFSSGISFDGSTANGVLTFKDSDEATVESNLTFDGTDLAIASSGKLLFGGGSHTYINEDIDDRLRFFVGGTEMFRLNEINDFASFFTDVALAATDKLYFDGGSHTYITESANDLLDVYVGGTNLLRLEESGTDSVFTTDNVRLGVGTHKDLVMYHDGSNNYIDSVTSDQDLYIRVNDGGSTTTAILIDASEIGRVKLPNDNQYLSIGASGDLYFYHDSSNSLIRNATGDLILRNDADDAGIRLQCDDGSGGTTNYITCDGQFTSINLLQSTALASTKKLFLDGGGGTYVHELSDNVIEFRTDNNPQLKIDNSAGVIINDGSYSSFDFRVESNNNTHMLFVDSGNDRVGIGVGTPATKLEIKDTRPVLRITDSSSGTADTAIGTIEFYSEDTSGNYPAVGASIKAMTESSFGSGHGLAFLTNADSASPTERVRIDEQGNVGIGVTNPGEKLEVNGSIALSNNTYFKARNSAGTLVPLFRLNSSNHIEIINGNSTNGDIIFKDASDTNMTIKGDTGNVGIGTSSPGTNLEVKSTGNTTTRISTDGDSGDVPTLQLYRNGAAYAQIHYEADGGSNAGVHITDFRDDANSHIIFNTRGDNERMRIEGDGSVGIGTTSPGEKLEVSGGKLLVSGGQVRSGSYLEGFPSFSFANDTDTGMFSDTANQLEFSTGGSSRLTINSSGDVKIEESLGIGVAASSTTGRLDCSNDVVAFSTSDKKLKENIKPLDNALDKVLKISGVEFDWKELTEKEKETIHGNQGHDVGVIAQEIEEVLPEVVTTRDTGYKAVKYEKIVPLLIQAIKEQQKQIEELKNG